KTKVKPTSANHHEKVKAEEIPTEIA
ncbi:polymer-forming cytoskeletal family protein, partial [Yersinia enterocolitica]|nr:polymer-forming cytoskeletal family protein [Yersinia enterocolitica]